MNNLLVVGALAVFFACGGQGQGTPANPSFLAAVREGPAGDTVSHIDGEIRGIWQDSKGNMWFASNGEGVFRYDGKTMVNLTEKHGLASNYVWLVQEGKDGNMWFKSFLRSTSEMAVCCFEGNKFTTVQPDKKNMNDVFQNGFLLCGYSFNGKTLSEVHIPETSPIENAANKSYQYDIYATCLDSQGNAWFGTCTTGLCKYDGKSYTWFTDSALAVPIRDIFEDKSGTLWVGNNGGGLFRYDGERFVHFSKEQHLDNPDFPTNLTGAPGSLSRVWKIAQDKQGDLWAATIDSGIRRYDGKSLTNYTTRDGLGTNAIWTIYFDKNDRLWVGTAEAGVYVFNGKNFDRFLGYK